ncbi:MAG: cytochrome P450 [Myxococcales bacterium]|nr:cytochrome P450 [Myxococcales bacterium]
MALNQVPIAGSFFEQLRTIRTDRIGGLRRFNDEGRDIGRFAFVFGDVVLVNTPEAVHEVLVTHAKSFEKSPILRAALHPLAGQGLFTSEGDLWRRQRRLMAPLFQPSALRGFADEMTRCAERAVATWRDGQVLDVAHETTRIAMSVAGRTLFDIDTFDETDSLGDALTTALDWAAEESGRMTLIAQARFKVALERLADRSPARLADRLRGVADRSIEPIMWPSARTRELRAALDRLEARVARMIEERRKSPGDRTDLLSLLLAARDDDGSGMSDRQVRDEVLTLFVAGHETTANALAWGLMLLAQHPEVYAELRREVDALGRAPTFDDLPRLDLALRVFKESLRMYPPVYLFGRIAVADVSVGGYALPKGTVVLVSPFSLHHRPDVWPDPERFDPGRFTAAEEARRHKSAFVPFSAGPRTCIGNHFALMEGPLVLATILQRADLSLVDPRGAQPEPSATLRPRGGIPMKISLRR